MKIYYQYSPLWDLLSKNAVQKVRKGNDERIFDQARLKVRDWERTHVSDGILDFYTGKANSAGRDDFRRWRNNSALTAG